MDRFSDSDIEMLEIKAYQLFLAIHLEPDNPEARAALISWVEESPAHRRAFHALDQHLEEVAKLLDAIDPDTFQ
ncbi:MAG: DUF4880 domain-containing protein [Pseudomonas sp.]|uniref:DUF4880 domain-containing protein n=1 Tax=Pseudomonas sp. NFX224 TaxID=3402862 RepID=UPI003AFB2154